MSELSRLPARLFLLASAIAVLAALCVPTLAGAAPDTFMLGDGHEGAVAVTSAGPLSHSAPLSSAAASGTSQLLTGPGQLGADGTAGSGGSLDQTGFEAGRLVLVIQSSGLSPAPASGDQSPIDLAGGGIGRWELARVSATSGSLASGMTLTLSAPIVGNYGASGAQVVTVPEFTSVDIATGGQWKANPWNGSSGGITAFLATGAVYLEDASSEISASGAGFRGGLLHGGNATGCTQLDGETGGGKGEGIVLGHFPGTSQSNASRGNLANGGGGGNCSNAGGGGGANSGPGGTGGWAFDGNRDVGGLGGARLNYSAYERAPFGGGGGAGDQNNGNGGVGGAGGGFVFLRAQSLTGAGSLLADGEPGAASAPSVSGDGAGGGGAGGVLYARFTGSASCHIASARGGDGGNEASTTGVHGPGGGGGGGTTLLQSDGGSCASSASNGVAGIAINGGASHRGSAPSTADDPNYSGELTSTPTGGLVAPTVSIVAPAANAQLASGTAAIEGTTSIDFALVSVSIDGAAPQNTVALAGGQWSITPAPALIDGLHSISVSATAHGIASAVLVRSFTVDTTAPAAPVITSPAEDAAFPTSTPTLSGSAEPGATVEVYLAGDLVGSAVASISGQWSFIHPAALPDAIFTFTARQTDLAGNVSAQSPPRSFRIDARLPTVTIHAKPPAATNTRSATFNFDADEAAIFDCRFDGSGFAPCSAPVALSGLPDGSHTFIVRARDVSGNYSQEDAHSWTIDATPPAVSISQDSPPAGISPTFSFTSVEPGTTYRCRVAPAPFVSCSSPYNAPALPVDAYTFELRATDAFGNTAQQSVPFSVAPTSVTGPPVVSPPPKPPAPKPTTCAVSDGTLGVPAKVSLISARQVTRGVRFKLRSDGFILVSLELRSGKKLIAARVAPLKAGSRSLVVRSKRALPKNVVLTVRLSAVTMSGGKSAIDASLTLSGRTSAQLRAPGELSAGPAPAELACNREAGAKRLRVRLLKPSRAEATIDGIAVAAQASDYAIATISAVQNGKVIARRRIVLAPGRFNRTRLKPRKGGPFLAGSARLELRSISAQGARQSVKRSIIITD